MINENTFVLNRQCFKNQVNLHQYYPNTSIPLFQSNLHDMQQGKSIAESYAASLHQNIAFSNQTSPSSHTPTSESENEDFNWFK